MRRSKLLPDGGQFDKVKFEPLVKRLKDAVAFAILILILLFRPSGLLGTVAQEKV